PYCQKTGTVSLDRKGYLSGETIKIVVGDGDLVGQRNVIVNVTSSTTSDSETVTLNESKIPGQFIGSIPISFAATASGDGVLQSAVGDTFTVAYDDASTEQGSPARATATARATRLKAIIDDTLENGTANFKPDNFWKLTETASHSPSHSWTDSPNG